MPTEQIKILRYYQELKSIKSPFIIYADFQTILEKTNTCEKTTLKYPISQKINNHTACNFGDIYKSKYRQSFIMFMEQIEWLNCAKS